MIDKVIKLINKQIGNLPTYTIELPEMVSIQLDKATQKLIDTEKLLDIQFNDKILRNELMDEKASITIELMSIYQFIIEKYAPDEYKQLNKQVLPEYCSLNKKVTFTCAEEREIEQMNVIKKQLINNLIAATTQAVLNTSKKDIKNDKKTKE